MKRGKEIDKVYDKMEEHLLLLARCSTVSVMLISSSGKKMGLTFERSIHRLGLHASYSLIGNAIV